MASAGSTGSREPELRVAWRRHVGTGRAAEAELASVLARHREPHRRYHAVGHVAWVVRHVVALAADEPHHDLDAIVAAAFYHDAVYDPRATDNEAASARLAQRRLVELGWTAARAGHVARMIEATAGHLGEPGDGHLDERDERDEPGDGGRLPDPDTAILLDADLAVLGTDPAAYQQYATGVRAEYAHVPDADWRRGRSTVLSSLLARQCRYRTPTAAARWDRRAVANLTAELAALGAS